MMILALEFSSPRRSVGLLRQEHRNAASELLATASDDGARSVKPLPLIQGVLAQAAVKPEEVDTVLVGLGPGSYTGIRSAIALAQGWQLAREVRLLGVSTVECLAFQAQMAGLFGSVNIVIDAQRQEVYLARYQITPEAREQIEPLKLVSVEQLRQDARRADSILAGPEAVKWSQKAAVLFPEAPSLARVAVLDTAGVSGEDLLPIYLRDVSFVKAPPPRLLAQ